MSIWDSRLDRNEPLRSRKGLNPYNEERRNRRRLRAYGPPERRRMVKRMTCLIEGCYRQAENTHIKTGGMGMKAHYTTIVNLCGMHHRYHNKSLHNLGSVERFNAEWDVNLEVEAERVENEWQIEKNRLSLST